MADVKYIITADTDKAVKGIQRVSSAVDGMKKQAQRTASPMRGMWKQVAAGIGISFGVSQGLRSMIGFMRQAVSAAKEQELAEKGLTDALESTGREIPLNAEHFKEYAKEIQAATLYGDEQVLSAQALLVQLTNLDREGLDRATEGAVGLATVFKTDLKSATNLVAKALAGNYGALSRYGISVKDLNTDEEKRASLLEQLGTLYERAKGEVDTFEGVTTQLKNTFGDFMEKLGDVIIKSESLRESIGLIQQTINNFIDSGAMDNWAAKFDMVLKNVPLFDSLRRSLILLNIEMEGQILKQKWATKQGEKWMEFLKDSNKELIIFGVDIYGAMRGLMNFGREADVSARSVELLETSIDLLLAPMVDVKRVAKEAQPELKAMFEEAVPAARNLLNVVDQAPSEFEEAEDAGVQAAQNIKTEWELASERMQDAWAREIGEMITEFKSFKDFFKEITNEMWRIFSDMVGKMIVKWVTEFLQDVLIKKTKSAVSSATSTLVGQGAGGGGVGAAAGGGGDMMAGLGAFGGAFQGTLLANLLMGAGPSKQKAQDIHQELWEIKTLTWQTQQHELHWINDNLMSININSGEQLIKSDAIIDVLRRIRKNLESMPSGQGGLNFYSGSRSGFARYHPFEQVTIQPRMNFSPQFQTVVIEKNDKYIVNVVQQNLNRLNIRVPTQTLVTR